MPMNRRHYHIYHCFRLVQTERASCTGASVICQDARIRGFRVVDSGGARDPTLTSSSHRRNSRTQVAAKSDVYRMQLKASAPSVSKLGLLCRKNKEAEQDSQSRDQNSDHPGGKTGCSLLRKRRAWTYISPLPSLLGTRPWCRKPCRVQARPNALEPRLLRPGLTHVDLCKAMSRSSSFVCLCR